MSQRRTGAKPSFIIPAGNLGNAFAAIWARAAGFPIERIVLAHNANRTVPDFLASGDWRPRASIATLASAMDVGNPSNMERIRAFYPTFDAISEHLSAQSVDDATIRRRIGEDFMQFGREWCPHTATAAEVYRRLGERERRDRPWVLVATAHPAKFNDVVEPIIGKPIDVPAGARAAAQAAPALSRLAAHPQGGGGGSGMSGRARTSYRRSHQRDERPSNRAAVDRRRGRARGHRSRGLRGPARLSAPRPAQILADAAGSSRLRSGASGAGAGRHGRLHSHRPSAADAARCADPGHAPRGGL